jgi:predicted nucleic acid-binding protein
VSAGPEPQPVAVDASVVAKWFLRDETGLAEADRLFEARILGTITLIAPQHIESEVANSIRKAVLNDRIDRTKGDGLLAQWLGTSSARLRLVPTAPLLPAAWPLAFDYGVTLFDGMYIALADQLGIDLVVADERMLRSPAGKLPFIHDLNAFTLN